MRPVLPLYPPPLPLEVRKFDEYGVEEFGRLESSEKTIAILGD